MPSYSSYEDLVAALRVEMQKAMSDAESELYLTGLQNNSAFYVGTKPKKYKRTYQLRNALKTTGVRQDSPDECHADIYEDMAYDYTTGTFSTPKVFSEAERNGFGILGNPNFWRDTEEAAPKILDAAIKKHFK